MQPKVCWWHSQWSILNENYKKQTIILVSFIKLLKHTTNNIYLGDHPDNDTYLPVFWKDGKPGNLLSSAKSKVFYENIAGLNAERPTMERHWMQILMMSVCFLKICILRRFYV
jgi:hypothetical protein